MRKEVINIKKQIIVSVILLTIIGGGYFAVSGASAQGNADFHSAIIQRIADKFKLNKDDVQKVFDEERAEHQKLRQANFDENLNQAVKDGKITEAQKKLVQDKFNELQKKRQESFADFQNKSLQERRGSMSAQHQELKKWASDNGIDLDSIYDGFGMGKRGHRNGL